MGGTKRLLFFSLEDWNEVWRRNQFICAELVRRRQNLEILWVCPVVDFSFSLRRRTLWDLDEVHVTPQAVPGFPSIRTVKPLKLLPNKIGRSFNETFLKSQILEALFKLGWEDFDLWVNAQSARNLFPLRGAKRTIYDITDDWTKMPQPENQLRAVIADDAAMLDLAHHVIVCSEQLKLSRESKCKELSLIHNGVDNERYHPANLRTLRCPSDMRTVKPPIVGYTGTLHSSRLDVELIAKTADKLRDVSFVFVGPNFLTAAESERLAKNNIFLLGGKSYDELPKYVSQFDVCMTPHLVNEFTDSLDPLKLYEYMSTGKPIVSTACAGFRELDGLVRIAHDQDEFGAQIKTALATEKEPSAERIHWAVGHSWATRVDEIEKILGWT